MKIRKFSAAVYFSAEQVFMHRALYDTRYERRVKQVNITPPTEAEWADYRKAKEAHEYLLASPYFDDGGPDEGSSVSEPEPGREYIYAETVDEWIARCREIEGNA